MNLPGKRATFGRQMIRKQVSTRLDRPCFEPVEECPKFDLRLAVRNRLHPPDRRELIRDRRAFGLTRGVAIPFARSVDGGERAAEAGGPIGEAENGGRPVRRTARWSQASASSRPAPRHGPSMKAIETASRQPVGQDLLAIPCERRAIGRMSQAGECRGTKARAEPGRDRRAKDQGCEAGVSATGANGSIEFAQGFEIQRVGRLPAETERKRGGPVVGGHRDVTRLEQHGTGFCPHAKPERQPEPQLEESVS